MQFAHLKVAQRGPVLYKVDKSVNDAAHPAKGGSTGDGGRAFGLKSALDGRIPDNSLNWTQR